MPDDIPLIRNPPKRSVKKKAAPKPSSSPARIRLATEADSDFAIPAGFQFDEEDRLRFRGYCQELRALTGMSLLASDLLSIAHLVDELRVAQQMSALGRIALDEGNSPEFRALANAASRGRKNADTILYGLGLRRNERGHKERQRQAAALTNDGHKSVWGDLLKKPQASRK